MTIDFGAGQHSGKPDRALTDAGLRKIEFYDEVDKEGTLYYESIVDAVIMLLENNYPLDKPLPAALVVAGYAKSVPKFSTFRGSVLERLCESLDEDYGDPDDYPNNYTEKMIKAEEEFIKTVISEYTVWRCDQVATFTVDVQKFVRRHARHWLKDPKFPGFRGKSAADVEDIRKSDDHSGLVGLT